MKAKWPHTVTTERFTSVLLLIVFFSICFDVQAQDQDESERSQQTTNLEEALGRIAAASSIGLLYDPVIVKGKTTTCQFEDQSKEELLHCVLEGTGIHFRRLESGTYILVMEAEREKASLQRAHIRGRVIDRETRQPLQVVNVFLSRTLQGTATDNHGSYQITGVSPGAYQIVASMIGYKESSFEVEVQPGTEEHVIDFSLEPIIYELSDVEVTGRRLTRWKEKLARFEELLMGTSENAARTTILNPYALEFEEEDGRFYASASEPLEIENRGTGYHVTFVLNRFLMDEPNKLLYTNGSFYFRELEPYDDEELSCWRERRERTFKGSLQHLLWAMVYHRDGVEGFTIRQDVRPNAPYSKEEEWIFHPVEVDSILKCADKPYEFELKFDKYLRVEYTRRGDRTTLFDRGRPPEEQLSWITLNCHAAKVHESGYVYSLFSSMGCMSVYGYLATRRVADLLPREYSFQRLRVGPPNL